MQRRGVHELGRSDRRVDERRRGRRRRIGRGPIARRRRRRRARARRRRRRRRRRRDRDRRRPRRWRDVLRVDGRGPSLHRVRRWRVGMQGRYGREQLRGARVRRRRDVHPQRQFARLHHVGRGRAVPVSAPSTPPPASLDKKPRARAAIAAVPSSPPNGGRLRKPFKVNFRHPVSGRFIQIGAVTAQEAASYRQRIETLRTDLRLGGTTPEYVNRVLRRLQYGETTVERATHEYLCRRDLAKNTRKRMEQFLAHLPAEMRARDLADLLSDVIQPWLDRDLAHLEVSTRELHWWSLRAVVRYATKLGWVGAPPWGIWSPHFRGRVRGKRRESLRTGEEAVTFL